MHKFNYPPFKHNGKIIDLKDEFLHGWCFVLQYRLAKELYGAEPYEIWEKTEETNGEFWNDHQIIKYKGLFIDVRGIFTEEEILNEHKLECIKCSKFDSSSYIEMKLEPCKICSDEEYFSFTGLPTQCCDFIIENIINDIKLYF